MGTLLAASLAYGLILVADVLTSEGKMSARYTAYKVLLEASLSLDRTGAIGSPEDRQGRSIWTFPSDVRTDPRSITCRSAVKKENDTSVDQALRYSLLFYDRPRSRLLSPVFRVLVREKISVVFVYTGPKLMLEKILSDDAAAKAFDWHGLDISDRDFYETYYRYLYEKYVQGRKFNWVSNTCAGFSYSILEEI